MVLLGLLIAGLGVAALIGSFDGDDGGDAAPSSNDDTPIITDGDVGMLIEGDAEDDRIFGTEGFDILSGEEGDDYIRGGYGDDSILGGEGADSLFGQVGSDILIGGEGTDEIHGGRNDDNLLGGAGDDTLYGGPGNDTLIGTDITNRDLEVGDWYLPRPTPGPYSFEEPTEAEANELYGGEGDDYLLLGEGDTATGDGGSDNFVIGHWVEDENNVPVITDFNHADDVLTLYYPTGETAPTITFADDVDQRLVYADGQLVARLAGDASALLAGEVRLIEYTG